MAKHLCFIAINVSWLENLLKFDGLVWFLCLMAYQLLLGYLMPKPFSKKNRSGTI